MPVADSGDPLPPSDVSPTLAYLTQQDYRVYNDDGTVNPFTATPLAAKNVAADVELNNNARVRISLQETNNETSGALRYYLQYRINGGTWFVLDNLTQTYMKVVDSQQATDGTATTQQLGATSFTDGEFVESNRNTAAITLTSTGGNPIQTELEWNIKFQYSGGLEAGDIVQFRVVYTTGAWTGGTVSGTLLTSYVNYATVNITAPIGGISVAERATVYETSQFGVETTPGTPVAATIRLLASQFDCNPQTNIRSFRQNGIKAPTMVSYGKEYTEINAMGDMAINDLVYLLNSLLIQVAPTTPSNNGIWSVGVGAASAGTFTLTYGGITTPTLAYNISASDLQAILTGLPSIGGNVTVTGTAPSWTIRFTGPLSTGGTLSGSGAGLTGGAFTCTTTAAVNTRRWTFFPSFILPDTVKTYTMEKGIQNSATLAQQLAFFIMRQMQFKINKGEASWTGSAFAQTTDDSFSMTALTAAGDVEPVAVNPAQVSVYLGDSLILGDGATTGTITAATNASPISITSAAHGLVSGDIVSIVGVGGNTAANSVYTITKVDANTFTLDGSTGNGAYTSGGKWYKVVSSGVATKLTRCLDVEFGIGGRFNPIITLDDSFASFSGAVEATPELTAKVSAEHDAAGQTILGKVRTGTRQFLVVEFVSSVNIEGSGNAAYPFRAKFTMPFNILNATRTDIDGVYSSVFDGNIMYDTNFGNLAPDTGGFIKIEIDTDVATL